jgi:hypothetical protein
LASVRRSLLLENRRMPSSRTHIQIPIGPLGEATLLALTDPVSDAEFLLRQRDFIQQVFGHSSYLHTRARAMPLSDAFLGVLVNLIDVLDANAPDEARHCIHQLIHVLKTVSPQLLDGPFDGASSKP